MKTQTLCPSPPTLALPPATDAFYASASCWPPYSKTKCTTVSLFNRRWCMEQCYRHFDHKERTLIYWWRKEQLSLREIGRRLRRSHTSVSRELRRNRWCGKEYFPRGAQILAVSRLQRRAKRDRLKSKQVRAYVHGKGVMSLALQYGFTPRLG